MDWVIRHISGCLAGGIFLGAGLMFFGSILQDEWNFARDFARAVLILLVLAVLSGWATDRHGFVGFLASFAIPVIGLLLWMAFSPMKVTKPRKDGKIRVRLANGQPGWIDPDDLDDSMTRI
jgi:NhaP-type Na+/H+ or K+/H+ antiporter